MNKQEQTMEERFDELFVSTYKIWDCYNDKPAPKNVMEIKDFIKQEIDLAVQQEREMWLRLISCKECKSIGGSLSELLGYSECDGCGGDGHRLIGYEGESI